jgi:hypothetical protein
MHEKSSEPSYELDDAVVEDDEIDITPARFLRKKRKGGSGGIWIPPQIAARMKGATTAEWAMVTCLCCQEFRAYVKLQPLVLGQELTGHFGFTKNTKKDALLKLASRGILKMEQSVGSAVRVKIPAILWE